MALILTPFLEGMEQADAKVEPIAKSLSDSDIIRRRDCNLRSKLLA